jgi:hypothetical protein
MSIGTSPLGGWMVSAVLRTGLEESLPDAAQAVKVDR